MERFAEAGFREAKTPSAGSDICTAKLLYIYCNTVYISRFYSKRPGTLAHCRSLLVMCFFDSLLETSYHYQEERKNTGPCFSCGQSLFRASLLLPTYADHHFFWKILISLCNLQVKAYHTYNFCCQNAPSAMICLKFFRAHGHISRFFIFHAFLPSQAPNPY